MDFWWISCRFLMDFVVLGRWSGGFLVDFLSVSGGFCGSGRFSVECGLVDFLSVSGRFYGSVEFWVVW